MKFRPLVIASALAALQLGAAQNVAPPSDHTAAADRHSSPATTQAATEPAVQTAEQAFIEERDEMARHIADELKDLPELPALKPADVFSIRVVGDELVAVTTLADTAGERRIKLLASPYDIARVEIDKQPLQQDAPPAAGARNDAAGASERDVPQIFKLTAYQTSPTRYTQTEVISIPLTGQFQLVRDEVMAGDTLQVQLLQLPRILDDEQGDVFRMYVTRTITTDPPAEEKAPAGDPRDPRVPPDVSPVPPNSAAILPVTQPLRLQLSAQNFEQLRRKYPAETNRYLRPILRDLGNESPLFAADARAAWQVLAAGASDDPIVVARLKELLTRLDSDQFAQREAAQRDLRTLGQPAALSFKALDRTQLSAQQLAEVDAFLSTFTPLNDAEADRLRSSPDFLIDCLELTDPELRSLAWKRFKQVVTRNGAFADARVLDAVKFDPAAPATERAVAVERLRAVLMSGPAPTTPTPTPQP